MKHFIYDLETYPNYILFCFKEVGEDNWYDFEVSDRRSDMKALYRFIEQHAKCTFIGFNNLNFDYPILHKTILRKYRNWKADEIYSTVQEIIYDERSSIAPWEVKLKQIDLYKIWHYDNKNKRTSLKWLEFAMRMENVEDLPYAVGSNLSDDQKDMTAKYCRNDIMATEAFYELSEKHIAIRKTYSEHEDLDLINASEIKMAKSIFGKHLSKTMEIPMRELRDMKTFRSRVEIKDIVFDYIKFNDPINIQTLQEFKDRVWISPDVMKARSRRDRIIADKRSKNSIKFSVKYKNVVREYAEGGLHSFGRSGIYETKGDYMLVDVDFASYYPHLCFKNALHPSHIPVEVFNKIYEGFYTERKKYPKSDPRNYVLKIVLNGSYGLSKDKYSFLFDPKWQLSITVNGQLLLTYLTEKVYEYCKHDVKIIFENTDGAMYYIHKDDYDNLTKACEKTEMVSAIPLETQVCKKVIARDVNNYINIIDDDYYKFKGVFEIDRDYHKNHSKRVVPLALANYYINGFMPDSFIYSYITANETYINKSKDEPYENHGIYDFCLGAKMKGSNTLVSRKLDFSKIKETPQPKMTRYYVSNDGVKLIKVLPPLEKNYLASNEKHKQKVPEQLDIFDFLPASEDNKIEPSDREEELQVGFLCTIFNKFTKKKETEYNINYTYYIDECFKIIKSVENE